MSGYTPSEGHVDRAERCACCGRKVTTTGLRIASGSAHFDCWNEHHSDPSGVPWPSDHRHEKGASDDAY